MDVRTEMVPLNLIWADEEFNSRGVFSASSVATLADDIEERTQLQPIQLQPCVNAERGTIYKVVMGHRRFAAFQLLARRNPEKFGMIRAEILPAPLDDAEALLRNLKENLERVDLNMLEEARGISRFQKWGWSAARVAKELKKPKKWVETRWGLLHLPEEIQKRAATGYLSQYQVEECIGLRTRDDQIDYVRRIVDNKEKGKRIPVKLSERAKKNKTMLSIMTKGEPRSLAEMALVQESIQDSFQDKRHPAAMMLAWAMGVISYEELVEQHIEKWVIEENDKRANENKANIEFRHHPQLLAKELV